MEDKDKKKTTLDYLIEEGNQILDEHIEKYGYLRGFKKQIIKTLLQNELDGGDEREINAFELNDYRMPRWVSLVRVRLRLEELTQKVKSITIVYFFIFY